MGVLDLPLDADYDAAMIARRAKRMADSHGSSRIGRDRPIPRFRGQSEASLKDPNRRRTNEQTIRGLSRGAGRGEGLYDEATGPLRQPTRRFVHQEPPEFEAICILLSAEDELRAIRAMHHPQCGTLYFRRTDCPVTNHSGESAIAHGEMTALKAMARAARRRALEMVGERVVATLRLAGA